MVVCAPQIPRDDERINPLLHPPVPFGSGLMQILVVRRAQRNGELVRDFASQCIGLRVGQMMGLGAVAAADNAAARGNVFQWSGSL